MQDTEGDFLAEHKETKKTAELSCRHHHNAPIGDEEDGADMAEYQLSHIHNDALPCVRRMRAAVVPEVNSGAVAVGPRS
eukprot:3807942-Heterocapsa_arctica.AAC.1